MMMWVMSCGAPSVPWLCHDEVWLVVVLCVEESESDFSVAVVEG